MFDVKDLLCERVPQSHIKLDKLVI